MIFHSTAIIDVKRIVPDVYADDRGTFHESWNSRAFAVHGIEADFVQDNHSRSARGVLRGLHYQYPAPQGKLVRVVAGRAWDVAVDLRPQSVSFGQWAAAELSAENREMLWVPPGFAHGFLALEDDTEFLYKCTDYYMPDCQKSLAWNDPDLAIDWPLEGMEPILSPKDHEAPLLSQIDAAG
ncbi:dTDP-4-dehydrorhamnose 3,5-epimerase [Altericroceibacterium endophyticum]|uniref:dTDP-4-dehydrorhamnose 3,5-epimerase n=1 Tax=Altericroceibacterium endophyticum TaxID=1808508 RepID=A0A6I4T2D6_9SPHN|nr:dTDP-4-dehydrorhamnose 3,5-epimerase [Altericroceibacterium endophyticum]MXO64150.1 dTDP-4-dehydrorhamnose 3,5-epimerase [Altericroceibacterium endophyticum]